MNNYSVYMHTTPNQKRYIGITGKDPKKRWNGGSGYYYNREFHKAIKTYGWNNIKHQVLFQNLSKEEAEQKERELIAKYDTTNPNKGFNYTKGGNHQGMTSDATRKLISRKARKVPCMCVETGEIFESISDAAQHIGIHPSSISNSCTSNGKSSCKGKHFVYVDKTRKREIEQKRRYTCYRWW